ncbi:hypothetical protein [Poseidonocella sp. HB161398]|uniref:hypothetical protein n=1 Tax=Poseidonocella sp. HB161398 TaxID=2320855 RepID=UPI001108673F|nr:hypothetical protein [Poseidonocella sp. HB161398]
MSRASSSPRRSNLQKRDEAIRRVAQLIAECEAAGETLPARGGALWQAEIKRRAGLGNSQITGNPEVRRLLAEHAARHGLAWSLPGSVAPEEELPDELGADATVPMARYQAVKRELAASEKACAELRARLVRAEAELRRHAMVEELIALGGRYTPPGDGTE